MDLWIHWDFVMPIIVLISISNILVSLQSNKNEFDLETIMVIAYHGGTSQGDKVSHLSKIWRIDAYTTKKHWTVQRKRV